MQAVNEPAGKRARVAAANADATEHEEDDGDL